MARLPRHPSCSSRFFLLLRLLPQEGDQVVPILGLLQPSKSHLRAGNVFLWIFEVLKQGVFVPLHICLLVRVGVREALNGASVAAKEAMEVGPDLVALTFLQRVALRTPRLEEVGALLGVTWKSKGYVSTPLFSFLYA